MVACAYDNTTRMMPWILAMEPTMTVQRCANLAMAQGYPVFGLQYGTTCYAGVSMQRTFVMGIAPAERCNAPCGGNSATTCGGNMALSVYEFYQCAGG